MQAGSFGTPELGAQSRRFQMVKYEGLPGQIRAVKEKVVECRDMGVQLLLGWEIGVLAW